MKQITDDLNQKWGDGTVILTLKDQYRNMSEIIAQCRKEKSLTQIQLAELLDITNQAVSKWENGVSHS